MTSPRLSPALRHVLELAAECKLWADPARETTRWMANPRPRAEAIPVTAAVQSLIDAGLLADGERVATMTGTWRFALPTDAGRALLANPNQPEGR